MANPRMMRASSMRIYALATALLAGAATFSDRRAVEARELTDFARAAIRPLLLPSAWSRQHAAYLEGDAERLLTEARVMAELLPEWEDGHVHVAWQLAFDLAQERPPEDAAELLLRAVAALQDRAAIFAEQGRPRAASELLLSASTILEHRCHRDPALAESCARLLGNSPIELSNQLIRTALQVHRTDVNRRHVAFAASRLVTSRLRVRDLDGAEAMRKTAIRLLADLDPATGGPETCAQLRQIGDLRSLPADPARLTRIRTDAELSALLGAAALDALGDLATDSQPTERR